jgi:hypothetical protein
MRTLTSLFHKGLVAQEDGRWVPTRAGEQWMQDRQRS